MLDTKDLQAIAGLLEPINTRLDRLEAGQKELKEETAELKQETAELKRETLELKQETAELKRETLELKKETAALKESQEETRGAVNRLIEWADACGYVVRFPLPQI